MNDSCTREYMIGELQKRDMQCTLIEDVLPEMKGTDRQKNDSVIRAFDTMKGEFRSFKVENVVSFS